MNLEIHRFAEIPSTQDALADLAYAGAGEGTCVLAAAQSAGRGRHGNVWTSVPGNLYTSILLRPRPGDVTGDYSFVVALALYDAVASFLSDPSVLTIKWPNDLLLAGVKGAGILLESPKPGVLLAGMGVNLASAPPDRARVCDYTGGPVGAEDLLKRLAPALVHWVDVYRAQGLAPVLEAWISRAAGVGGAVRVRLPGEIFSGIWAGLDERGALCVRLPDGTVRKVLVGEVFFGPDHGSV